MRAAVFRGVGRKLSIEDVPMPVPGEGELILKVAYCGICGSDLHLTQPGAMLLPEGSILGHEFAGEIVETRGSKWRAGQRVAAIPLWECDLCAPHGCQKGLGALCQQNRFIGVADGVPGAYAQYVKLRDSHVLPLPDAISLRDAALLEPLAVGRHGVAEAGDLTGRNVLVIGAGPIGLATALCARLAGARRVVISELTDSRRAIAGTIDIDGVVDPSAGPVGKSFSAIAGAKPDVIFECVGVPGLIQQAVALSQPCGRIVVIGVCMVQDTFLPVAAISKELNIQFVMGYTRADFDYVLDHVAAGRIEVEKLITTVVGFDELPDVFEELRSGAGHTKVLIRPN